MMPSSDSIVICAEVYSSNLGDGVIVESLRYLINSFHSDFEIKLVDLSCRKGFGLSEYDKPSPWKNIYNQFAKRSSEFRTVSSLATWYSFWRNKHRSYFLNQMKDSKLLIIGGGQLLNDNNLFFPLRIREVVRCANQLGMKIVFHACGVGNMWSNLGRHFFKEALFSRDIISVSVRDDYSLENIKKHLPKLEDRVNKACDPAIWAAEAYDVAPKKTSDLVGLGIIAPEVLRRHSVGIKPLTEKNLIQFWIELSNSLLKLDQPFMFFTNGSTEDYNFAKKMVSNLDLPSNQKSMLLLDRPKTPKELVADISKFQVVVAYRLHANIIAFSLKIPSVGLIWDEKVRQFGKESGRSNFYLEGNSVTPKTVENKIFEAVRCGVNEQKLEAMKASAMESVKKVILEARR